MIDIEHFDMDTIDNASDTVLHQYITEHTCVLCGKESMPDALYCYECWQKWGTEA